MIDYKPIISQRLKYYRQKYDITQTDIANDLGVTQSTYANWELGRRMPDLNKILQIADYYNTTIDTLMGRTDI